MNQNKVDNLDNIRRNNMKLNMHIAFFILTFHHQNITRYHVHLVRHHHFFMKTTYDCSATEPQQSIQLNRCKTLVLVAHERKTLYFRNIVFNDDVTPFKISGKNSKQMIMVYYGPFGRFGLFKRISRKFIPSRIIHATETSFSTK